MKTVLAILGGIVVILALLGILGVGHFTLLYGPDKMNCTYEDKK